MKILVTIRKGGEIIVDSIDYKGNACLEDLQKLLQALEGLGVDTKLIEQQLKPEIHEREVIRHGW